LCGGSSAGRASSAVAVAGDSYRTLLYASYITLKGLPNLGDRFVQYGIKVSFWGSGTLKIVIYVENYPQK